MSAVAWLFIGLWIGATVGFFFGRAVAGCVLFALLAFCPTPAEALTKQECIHLGYGCQWSRATGGKANGWYFTTGKKPAAGKSSKADVKAVPSPSSTPMSAVVDAVASAFGGTDRQSSTRGSKSENVRNADGSRLATQHPQSVALRLARADASRSAVASERHQSRAVEPQAAAEAQERQQTPRLTLQQGYEEGARLLSIRLGAEVALKYGAKVAEARR